MECSTRTHSRGDRIDDRLSEIVSQNWQPIQELLPIDFEATARQRRALVRRREIKSAKDLLRLVLMYALSDWSLRLVGGWALLQGIGYLSDVAVLKRLRGCVAWLGWLISWILQKRCRALRESARVRLRLMDASVLLRPGVKQPDWRLHVGLNLWPLGIDGVELTDAHSGESLARLAPQDNEIRVADRGYAFVSSLTPLLEQATWLVVRITWQNLPLQSESGERFELIPWLQTLTAPSEQLLWLPTPAGRFALRVLAGPLPPQAAERARRRARKQYGKKGRTVSPNTLLAAGFLLLITNLPADPWPMARIFWLYRLRWQIELAFKRLKSLIQIDHLRAQDPRLVQTYLLGKILAALILDQLTNQVAHQQPDWFLSLERPVSVWRLTQFVWESLRQWVFGALSWQRFLLCLPALQRYFCDSPRARPQQLTWARAFLDHLSGSFSLFSG